MIMRIQVQYRCFGLIALCFLTFTLFFWTLYQDDFKDDWNRHWMPQISIGGATDAHPDAYEISYDDSSNTIHFSISLPSEFSFTNNEMPDWLNQSVVYHQVDVVGFYRIPKTGGSELIRTMKKLGAHPELVAPCGFKMKVPKQSHVEIKAWVGVSQEEATYIGRSMAYSSSHIYPIFARKMELAQNDSTKTKPIILTHGHVRLVDSWEIMNNAFKRSNYSNIKFMTVLRDPVDRMISFYWYIRGRSGGWRAGDLRWARKIIKDTKNASLADCVLDMWDHSDVEDKTHNTLCGLSENYQTLWYCGMDATVCDPNNVTEASLLRAMSNIDNYVHFVGFLSEAEFSMFLFRLKFPQSFDKDDDKQFLKKLKTYKIHTKIARQKYKYSNYPQASQSVKNLLSVENRFDVLLYQWAYERFMKHFGSLRNEVMLQYDSIAIDIDTDSPNEIVVMDSDDDFMVINASNFSLALTDVADSNV